jgi:hypothetical protein
MEADISIWRKTGHFYFALTREYPRVPASTRVPRVRECTRESLSKLFRNVPILTSLEMPPFRVMSYGRVAKRLLFLSHATQF